MKHLLYIRTCSVVTETVPTMENLVLKRYHIQFGVNYANGDLEK